MKTNILTAALSLLTLVAVAQKDEIKNAEDAIDDGKFAEAKAQLKIAEPNLSQVNDKWQERFYFFKGQAYSSGNPTAEDMKMAAAAFQKASEMGNDDATQKLMELKNNMIQSAINDQNNEDYGSAAEKLYTSYELSPQDTIYLYYAANNYVQAQDYGKAVEYLETLNELGYDGSGKEFVAVNIETGETESFGSKEQRDIMVKANKFKDPDVRKIPSKKGDIAGLIARIYINQKEYERRLQQWMRLKPLILMM